MPMTVMKTNIFMSYVHLKISFMLIATLIDLSLMHITAVTSEFW
jgi:hypothetical protein